MDIASYLEYMLRGASAEFITNVFLWILTMAFLVALFVKNRNKYPAFTQYTPTFLTSLGILGTFTGIIVGLLDFNVNDVVTSIGPLLEGLKTAFITSLAGMAYSILFKVFVSAGLGNRPDEYGVSEDEVGALQLYEVMKQQVDGINQLKKAISDSDESSLLGQLKVFRMDLSDNHRALERHLAAVSETLSKISEQSMAQQTSFSTFKEKLWNKLQDFADMMSKSATEQVIEALNKVITDFNRQLTEQFGENFKKLNEAVFELVQWQENYRLQLAEMKNQYDHGVQAITLSGAAVTSISNDAKVIPDTMNNLKAVMEVNQHQIAELDRHLNAFKEVRDRAVMAVPEIQDQIDMALDGARKANDQLAAGIIDSAERIQKAIGESADQYRDTVDRTRASLTEAAQVTANSSEEIKDQFSGALSDINNHMRNLIAELQAGGKELGESYKAAGGKLMTDTSDYSRTFTKSMESTRSQLESALEQQATEMRKQVERIFSGLEGTIGKSLESTGEAVEKKVNMLDKAMEAELQNALQRLGNKLGSVTEKFATDYERLTAQMQRVVSTRL